MFDANQHCRIGRVRMKEGGADVKVMRVGGLGELANLLARHARTIAQSFTPDLAGYFIIAWDKSGGFNCASRIPDECAIPLSLFPAWLAEVARRELVTTHQIHQVIDRDYIVPPPLIER